MERALRTTRGGVIGYPNRDPASKATIVSQSGARLGLLTCSGRSETKALKIACHNGLAFAPMFTYIWPSTMLLVYTKSRSMMPSQDKRNGKVQVTLPRLSLRVVK